MEPFIYNLVLRNIKETSLCKLEAALCLHNVPKKKLVWYKNKHVMGYSDNVIGSTSKRQKRKEIRVEYNPVSKSSLLGGVGENRGLSLPDKRVTK